jgi:hypothetical protein
MIGTTAALIMGGAAIAGHLAKAKLESSAAGKAAKTQAAASQQAMGVQKQVYDQQMAGMAPYAKAGANSMNTLSRLMTPGVPYSQAMQQQDAAPVPPPGGMGPAPLGGRPRGLTPSQGTAMPQPGTIPQRQPAAPAPMAGAGGTIQLRAPDGSTSAVPSHLAEQFIARGAQRV